MSEVARQLLSLARHGDGGTVALNGRPLPSTGFYVGGKVPSLVVEGTEIDDPRQNATVTVAVIRFVHRAGTAYVGAWRDSETNKVHFDAVEWYQEEHTARAVGSVRGEIALWDIAEGREVRI